MAHALAALVLGNLCFASFLERAHLRMPIQSSNPLRCNSVLCGSREIAPQLSSAALPSN
jgi:hypothetical protein